MLSTEPSHYFTIIFLLILPFALWSGMVATKHSWQRPVSLAILASLLIGFPFGKMLGVIAAVSAGLLAGSTDKARYGSEIGLIVGIMAGGISGDLPLLQSKAPLTLWYIIAAFAVCLLLECAAYTIKKRMERVSSRASS